MTAAELIVLLQGVPPNMPVVVMNFAYEDAGNVVEVVGPNDECPNAVYLVMDDDEEGPA